jgi:hypothetical protein
VLLSVTLSRSEKEDVGCAVLSFFGLLPGWWGALKEASKCIGACVLCDRETIKAFGSESGDFCLFSPSGRTTYVDE